MFTLKLYQSPSPSPNGREVIMECAGIWKDHCGNGIQYVQAFKKKVGVMDEDGPHDFYVGGHVIWEDKPGTTGVAKVEIGPDDVRLAGDAIARSNYYGWAVLENANGKTTEVIR